VLLGFSDVKGGDKFKSGNASYRGYRLGIPTTLSDGESSVTTSADTPAFPMAANAGFNKFIFYSPHFPLLVL
jgi:hypothetical protein